VIVSAETAELTAGWYGWTAEDELLLYVIHGTLHLVGYDDTTPETQIEMRERERACLACFGVEGRYDAPDNTLDDSASGGKKVP
jgi:probable rRNA maturation factor